MPLTPEKPWTWRTLLIVLYSVGVSERKIGEIVGDLLGHRYSHATVSRITEVVQERVQAFRERHLESRYAVIYLDTLFAKVLRAEAGIRREAAYVALGVTQGRRGSGKATSSGIYRSGAQEVLVFVTDHLPGMEEAIRRTFSGAD